MQCVRNLPFRQFLGWARYAAWLPSLMAVTTLTPRYIRVEESAARVAVTTAHFMPMPPVSGRLGLFRRLPTLRRSFLASAR